MVLHIVSADKFVEIALLTIGCLVLHHQSEIISIKIIEPLVPFDLLERVPAAVAGKIKADYA
jgi:hypothetical protein